MKTTATKVFRSTWKIIPETLWKQFSTWNWYVLYYIRLQWNIQRFILNLWSRAQGANGCSGLPRPTQPTAQGANGCSGLPRPTQPTAQGANGCSGLPRPTQPTAQGANGCSGLLGRLRGFGSRWRGFGRSKRLSGVRGGGLVRSERAAAAVHCEGLVIYRLQLCTIEVWLLSKIPVAIIIKYFAPLIF